jgi:hypothetical protein
MPPVQSDLGVSLTYLVDNCQGDSGCYTIHNIYYLLASILKKNIMNLNIADHHRSSMIRHRYGYTLYEPELASRLHPGMLGFLYGHRRWHPLLNLTDPIAVKAAGFDLIKAQILSETNIRSWGPLSSSTVNENEVVLAAGTDALSLDLPVGISGYTEYSTSTNFGAVLMCDDKVESIFACRFCPGRKEILKLWYRSGPTLRNTV